MEYSFIKGYKQNNEKRNSFIKLARDTFGIDFGRWYEGGFWNDNYICYSFEHGGEIVSNVSVNLMSLVIDGRERDAVQIGTVMTHPDHRKRGLAKSLLKNAIENHESRFFFLAANGDAVPLYRSCGFEPAQTFIYEIDLADYRRAEKSLEPAAVSPQELLDAKRMSVPLSRKLSASGDEHVLMFYYLHGFASCIYRPWPDTFVIFETERNELHIYDILSPVKISLKELLERIAPRNAVRAVCHFMPDEDLKGLKAVPDPEAGWMTLGGVFPASACFPRISQT